MVHSTLTKASVFSNVPTIINHFPFCVLLVKHSKSQSFVCYFSGPALEPELLNSPLICAINHSHNPGNLTCHHLGFSRSEFVPSVQMTFNPFMLVVLSAVAQLCDYYA